MVEVIPSSGLGGSTVIVNEREGGNLVEQMVHNEPLYKKIWRPMLAGVYILLVVFDFLIMPIIIVIKNSQDSNRNSVTLALEFKESAAQIQALKTFAERRAWNPLTLLGGGMLHISFGALLTGAAITRGMEKREYAKTGRSIR